MKTGVNHDNALREGREVFFCETPPFPRNMMIELTNACNHKCIFCGYKDMVRKLSIADIAFTKKIMEEAFRNGTREVGFYLIGEPFLNKDFAEYVKHAKEIGFEYIYVTSNGGEATPDKLKAVIKAGLDSIKFSINGGTRESYKKIHGKDDFEKVKKNIEWLRGYLDINNIPLKTFISFVECNYNCHDVATMKEVFGDLVDRIYFYKCGNQGGAMTKLIEDGVVDSLLPVKAPCSMIFNRLYITVEGYLDACCGDVDGNLVVADLHNTTLKDAWNSEAMIDLRKQHLNGFTTNNMCVNCVNNTNFNVTPLINK